MKHRNSVYKEKELKLKAIRKDYNEIYYRGFGVFKLSYIIYTFIISARVKRWEIAKRYSDFYSLNNILKKKIILVNEPLPNLPPKKMFSLSEKEIHIRYLMLEIYLNNIFTLFDVLEVQEIREFIEIPNDIISVYKPDLCIFQRSKRSVSQKSSELNDKYPLNNTINYSNENMFNNFYKSIYKMASYDINNTKSPNLIVIEEFLRNLLDNSENISDTIDDFEKYIKGDNDKWLFFKRREINSLFNGFQYQSEINKNKPDNNEGYFIHGLLAHIGNIEFNPIGAQRCLDLLVKLIKPYFNLQFEDFINVLKDISIESILAMNLQQHILSNNNKTQLNAFIVLEVLLSESLQLNEEVTRLLDSEKAIDLFINWMDNKIKSSMY